MGVLVVFKVYFHFFFLWISLLRKGNGKDVDTVAKQRLSRSKPKVKRISANTAVMSYYLSHISRMGWALVNEE